MAKSERSSYMRYRIVSHLGTGEEADAFRAVDLVSGNVVVLKVGREDRSEDSGGISLRREYEILRSVNEPALPEVTAYRHSGDGRPAIVMEWIKGLPLDQVSRPLPWNRETLGALFGLFSAVESLHRSGWVHLDIKPANVIFQDADATDGGQSKVRLLDAGLMARLGDVIVPRGTPGYIAPELLDHGGTWDSRADLFSLGAVCFRLLTGEEAFQGTTAIEVLRRSALGDRRHLGQKRLDLPPPFVELVEALLAIKPELRPGGSSEALRILERVSELEGWEPPVAHLPTWRTVDCLPWPPIPRMETDTIIDFLARGGPPRIRLVEVEASAGLGRESFARDLADRIAFTGSLVEAVVGSQGLSRGPVDADSLWITALTGKSEAVDGLRRSGERMIGKLADCLWKTPATLVWDLGSVAPVWLGKWIDELGLSLASVSARKRGGGHGVPSIVVLYGSKPSSSIEREIDVPALELKLKPLEENSLKPYVRERLSSVSVSTRVSLSGEDHPISIDDLTNRIVQSSQGYPEILEMQLYRWMHEGSVAVSRPRTHPEEDPRQVLVSLLFTRSKSLGDNESKVLRILECTSSPLDPETLLLATEVEETQMAEALDVLQAQRLVLHGTGGFEVSYRDLLDQGYRLTEAPTGDLHQRIADALTGQALEGSPERWLARARHLIECESAKADRVTLIAALRLYRSARFEEARGFLESWRKRRNSEGDNRLGLWCLRLLLQVIWESRDYERFAELRGLLRDDDPTVVSMDARILAAKGQPDAALGALANVADQKLAAPIEVFRGMARAFALGKTEGPVRFCREAQTLASKLPKRGYASLKSVLLQRWAQEALRCADERGAEKAADLLDAFSERDRDPLLKIGALVSRAYFAFHHADLETAANLATEALETARAGGYTNQAYTILSLSGGIAFEAGRWEDAIGVNRESLAIDDLTKSYLAKINTLRNLCLIRRMQALYEAAIAFGEQAVELARDHGADVDEVSAACMLAMSYVAVGRREDAWRIMRGGGIVDGIPPGLDKATVMEAIAHSAPIPESLAPREIEPTLALEAYNTDLEAGLKDNAAELALEVAWDALRADCVDEAREWLERSESFPKGKVPRIDIWRALVNGRLVAAEEAWGRPEGTTAWNEIEEAIKLARKWGFYELLWRLEYIKAHGLMMQGRREEAIEQLRQAKSTMDRIVNAMKEERHRRGYLSRPDQSRLLSLLEALNSQ
jgi:serine/threonine protein kinase/tetratricopeptide (TPR) repeat protein